MNYIVVCSLRILQMNSLQISLQIQEIQFYDKFVDWWINIFIFSMLLSAFANFHNLFLFVKMRSKLVSHFLKSNSWSLGLKNNYVVLSKVYS